MDAIDDDLLAMIVRNNVGLWTFVQCSAVCKRLHRLCQSDESLLLSAALYTAALTRTRFMGLFALTHAECSRFPHTVVTRGWASGNYSLYHREAIEHALRTIGGMAGWRTRLAARASRPPPPPRPPPFVPFGKRVRRRQWELDEDLHRGSKRIVVPIGYSVGCLAVAQTR